jgi:hypothetical protein
VSELRWPKLFDAKPSMHPGAVRQDRKPFDPNSHPRMQQVHTDKDGRQLRMTDNKIVPLVHIQVADNISPEQLHDTIPTDEGFQRSVLGALYIRPGTIQITEDELDFITKSRPDIAKGFTIISRPIKAEPVVEPEAVQATADVGGDAGALQAVPEPATVAGVPVETPLPNALVEVPASGNEAPQEVLADAVSPVDDSSPSGRRRK